MITEADVRQAVAVWEGMDQADIDRCRAGIRETEARIRAASHDGTPGAVMPTAAPQGWTPVEVALMFALWVSSNESLERCWARSE